MLAATLLVTVMYVAFVMSYAEIACALPRAGGVFIYANRAYGTTAGFAAGVSQLIEFCSHHLRSLLPLVLTFRPTLLPCLLGDLLLSLILFLRV